MKRIFALAIVIFAGWTAVANACEFCTLHNGLGQYNNQGDFVSVTERYTSASALVNGGSVVGPNNYAIQINTVQFMYQHAFSDDLKGLFSLPYFDKRSSGTVNDTSSGAGDMTAMARYTLWGHHDQFFAVLAGLKLPTGARKITPASLGGNGLLNTDLVLGTGSLDPLLGFVYSQNILSWSFSLDTLYKVSGKGYDGYQYGSVLNVGVSGYYRINNSFNAGLGFASEVMAVDNDTEGRITGTNGVVPNTGGAVVFLSPTLQYTYQNNYAEIGYMHPVYRNFTGTQTVVDGKVVLAYRHAF